MNSTVVAAPDLAAAVVALRAGGLVAMPTETVYGLGADARNPAALKTLVGQKAKVLPFPKDVMDLAYKESMKLYAEISAKNPNWKKVYDDYSDFRKEQNLWFRFTEARFDTYMQAQKL